MSTLSIYETNIPVFNLGVVSLKDLDQHLHRLVKTERKIMDEVLKVISEMDLRQGYLQLGFGSLFSYLVGLGYSESAAQRRITASRVLQKINIPSRHKVEQSIKEGSINLTQLSKVNSLFDYLEKLESQGEIIELNTAIPKLIEDLQGQNARNTDAVIEKTLNSILPSEKQKELKLSKKPKIKRQVTGQVKITLELSSELNKKLQKVLDLKSHAIPDRNVLTLFETLLDGEIKKNEGPNAKIKAQNSVLTLSQNGIEQVYSLGQRESTNANALTITNPSSIPTPSKIKNLSQSANLNPELNPKPTAATDAGSIYLAKTYSGRHKRKPISICIKRRVYQKAGHQCEYISQLTGVRCPETRFLNLDHIRPLALGGTNEETNIRCLCRSHNLAEAQRMGLKIPKANQISNT